MPSKRWAGSRQRPAARSSSSSVPKPVSLRRPAFQAGRLQGDGVARGDSSSGLTLAAARGFTLDRRVTGRASFARTQIRIGFEVRLGLSPGARPAPLLLRQLTCSGSGQASWLRRWARMWGLGLSFFDEAGPPRIILFGTLGGSRAPHEGPAAWRAHADL